MKRICKTLLLLAVALIMCGSLTSCALIEWMTGDTHSDISYVDLTYSEHKGLSYQGNTYAFADNWFSLETEETDIELGWHYNFPLSGRCGIYSCTADNPLFIWTSRYIGDFAIGIYIKENYDYLAQTYILDGTDVSFVLSDMISKTETELGSVEFSSSSEITLYLKEAPRLVIAKRVHITDGVYHFITDGQDWVLAEEFVSILKDNDLLS